MKKIFYYVITITTVVFAVSSSACKKNVNTKDMAVLAQATAADNLIYNTCGLPVNVFTPSANTTYNLAIISGDVNIKFGIPGVAELSFQNIDFVNFEFSGLYADKGQTIKLYRIKRTDGKYLSNAFAAANYTTKIEGPGSSTQLFILNSLGNNRYNLILPTMSVCNFMFTYWDNSSQKYRGAFVSSGVNHLGSKEIVVLPAYTTIPNTK